MKKLTSIFAVLFLMTLSVNVFAQNSASVSDASATAKIISKITLVNSTPLQFGAIAQTAAGGPVVIGVEGDDADFSGNEGSEIPTSTQSRAKFDVTGDNLTTFSISLPSSTVLKNADESAQMTLDSFTTNGTSTGNIISGNSASFFVGATLHVGASQAVDSYTGSYNVTVQYE